MRSQEIRIETEWGSDLLDPIKLAKNFFCYLFFLLGGEHQELMVDIILRFECAFQNVPITAKW